MEPQKKQKHSPKKSRWFHRLLRWGVRVVFFAVVLVLALWLLSPYIVKFTPLQTYIKNQIESASGGEVEFQSISFSPFGYLTLSPFEYKQTVNGSTLQINARTATASDLWKDEIQIDITGLTIRMNGTHIADVSETIIVIQNVWVSPKIKLSLDQGKLDPWVAQFTSSSTEQQESSAYGLSWLDGINVSQFRINLPNIESEYLWFGEITPSNTQVNASLRLKTPANGNTDSLTADAAWNLKQNRVEFIKFDAHHLPIVYSATKTTSMHINGSGSLQFESGRYEVNSDITLLDVVTDAPGIESIQSASVHVLAKTVFTPDFQYISLGKKMSHSPLTIAQTNDVQWNLPAGQSNTMVHTESESPLELQWQSPDLGEIAITSSEYPLSITSPITVRLNVHQQPVSSLLQRIPKALTRNLPELQGQIALHAEAQIEDTQLQHYEGRFALVEMDCPLGALAIHDASLSGPIHGSHTQHHLELTGNTGLGLVLNTTAPVELEPGELQVNIDYNSSGNSYRINIPEINTKYLNNVAFNLHNPMNWTLTGSLDTSTALAPLLQEAVPSLPRKIEGMGEVSLNAQGDANTMEINAESPDLTLYSFDADPSFGVQLRSFQSQTNIEWAKKPMQARIQMQAATPYLSYGGKDAEWPGDTLKLDTAITIADTIQYSGSLSPPGGGTVDIETNGQKYVVQLKGLDIETFVLPLLNRIVLDWNQPPYYATGRFSSYFSMANDLSIDGEVQLANAVIEAAGPPKVKFDNIRIIAPITYPIDPARLQKRDIQFQADRISIGEAEFAEVAAVIPLNATTIVPLQDIQVPMFDGTIDIAKVEIQNWQSQVPNVQAQFALDQINLAALHRIYPFLPRQGSISGSIRDVQFSTERFLFDGNLMLKLFEGEIGLQNLYVQNPFAYPKTIGFDGWIDSINLKPLTAYMNFGIMTGQISGLIKNFELILPPTGSDEWPRPIRFDLSVEKVGKEIGIVDRKALQNIVDLSENTYFSGSMADRDNYFYTQLGLKASLDGDNLRMFGTAKNNMFLYADAGKQFLNPNLWFAVPVNIKLANPNQVIPFERIWERLQMQIDTTGTEVKVD